MENAQTVSKVTGGVAASNLLGGETSGNMTMLDGFYRSDNYVYGSAGWSLESDNAYFWNVTISGTLVAANIHITDENTSANSFHVDSDGNTWWGCTLTNFIADHNNAAAYILKTGAARLASLTVVGGSIDATSTIGGRIASTLASAIDSSGHFADAAFSTASNTILGAFTFGVSGALQIGTYQAGVTGDIRISPTGILARDKNNATTFSLDATTGVGVLAGLVVGTNVGLGTAQDSAGVTTIVGNTVTTAFVNALNVNAATVSASISITSPTISGGSISIGSSNSIFKADSNGIYLGNATFASAPFSVSMAGLLKATSATIGGWTVNSTSIYTGTEDHSGYTANSGDLTIYSNGTDASIHAFKFYIDTAGVLNCTAAVISGAITTTASSSLDAQYISNSTIVNTLTMGGAATTGYIQSYGWNGTVNGFQLKGGTSPALTLIGGTITGSTITAKNGAAIVAVMDSAGVKVNGQNFSLYAEDGTTLYGYIGGNAGYYNIQTYNNRNMRLDAGSGNVISCSDFVPLTNGSAMLGNSSYTWNTIYGGNISSNNYYASGSASYMRWFSSAWNFQHKIVAPECSATYLTSVNTLRLDSTGSPLTDNGSIYFDGSHFYGRIGGAWKQLDN
jgi:hypothetical protein